MPAGPFILFAADELWRIASAGATDEVRVDREANAKQIATTLASKLHSRGYRGEGLLLALPASWCLSAVISTAGLPRQERTALAFRLEEKLPLAAENFTADFAPFADKALGVCVPNDKVRPLVEALEEAGVVVLSVSPAVMLAAQQLQRQPTSKNKTNQLLLWAEDNQANLIAIENAAPTTWALTELEPISLAMQLDLTLMESGDSPEILAYELPPETLDALTTAGHKISPTAETIDRTVTRLTPEILSGAISPWFELRRGAMAVEDSLRAVRRPINAALAAATLFCILLAAAFFYRSIRYDHLAVSYEKSLADEFQKEFPHIPLPMNPQATLLSEKKKLTLAGTSALPPETQESALRVMHDVLSKVPTEAKLLMDKMTFNDNLLELRGKSRAHEDVDAIVAAARAAGLDVPPPEMQKDAAGNWNFVVHGSKPIKAPLAGARE